MPNTIQSSNKLTTATVTLGETKGLPGAIEHEVHDGDTIKVRGDNFGVRFLGVDTPEISLQFPYPKEGLKGKLFPALSDPIWEDLLGDPFSDKWGGKELVLDPALKKYLKQRIKRDAGLNQYRWAAQARDFLLGEVQKDMDELGVTEETFKFFLLFANDITDRYGRFLCFIRPDEPEVKKARAKAKSKAEKDKIPYRSFYNLRMLQAGLARPYAIWPNLDPFRRKSLRAAAMPPGELQREVQKELSDARAAVKDARKHGKGFYKDDALALESFELRFMTRREPPSRWIIDIGKETSELIPPHLYFMVAPEDRLFVDEDYLPLFLEREKGWTLRIVSPPVVARGGRVKVPAH